jgi:hypothetical protein
MKYCLVKLLCVLLIAFCINCSADCNCSDSDIRFIPCHKTYVMPEQINFYEKAIFVQIEDVIIQTESLGMDTQGIFFANIVERDCGLAQWRCLNRIGQGLYCNACNWTWDDTCYACGGRGSDYQ